MNDRSRGQLARKLARTVAELCDAWTDLTGREHPASQILSDLAIDTEAFARDLDVDDAVIYCESLRRKYFDS